MTKIDLQRVLDLDAQATAGPWELDPSLKDGPKTDQEGNK